MFRFDFHIHSEYSCDSTRSIASIVDAALKKGLSGIAIADHNTFEGNLAAQKYVEENSIPLKIIPAQELETDEGEILALFIKREIKSKKFPDVLLEVHAQGGLIVMPHPYRNFPGFTKHASKFDFIEVHNSRTYTPENLKAMELAKRHGVMEIVGSDAHWLHEIGHDVVVFQSLKDIRGQLLRGLYATECAKRSHLDVSFCRNATAYVKGGIPYLFEKGLWTLKRMFSSKNAN